MNLSNKRVRFGELHVREFDLATMGEHPKAKGGFALQLGQRYQDLPPVAIPDKERMHGVKRRTSGEYVPHNAKNFGSNSGD
jgi:hypothetical protein